MLMTRPDKGSLEDRDIANDFIMVGITTMNDL